MFALITKEIQQQFEKVWGGTKTNSIPEICGCYGRACRQMGKEEGANRANCMYCPLAKFAEYMKK